MNHFSERGHPRLYKLRTHKFWTCTDVRTVVNKGGKSFSHCPFPPHCPGFKLPVLAKVKLRPAPSAIPHCHFQFPPENQSRGAWLAPSVE